MRTGRRSESGDSQGKGGGKAGERLPGTEPAARDLWLSAGTDAQGTTGTERQVTSSILTEGWGDWK